MQLFGLITFEGAEDGRVGRIFLRQLSLSLCLSIHYCVTLSPNTSLHLARTLSNSLSVAENLHLTSDHSKPVAEVHAENIFSAS